MLKILYLLVVSTVLNIPGEQYPQQSHTIETYKTQRECADRMQKYIEANSQAVTACFEAKMVNSNQQQFQGEPHQHEEGSHNEAPKL